MMSELVPLPLPEDLPDPRLLPPERPLLPPLRGNRSRSSVTVVSPVAALVFYIRKSILTGRALTVVAQQINKGEHTELKQKIKQKATDRKIEPYLANFLLDRGL